MNDAPKKGWLSRLSEGLSRSSKQMTEQVVDGVAAEAQFREHQQVHALLAGLFDQRHMLVGVGDRVGGMHHRRGRGDADEAVGGGAVKPVGLGQVDDPCLKAF